MASVFLFTEIGLSQIVLDLVYKVDRDLQIVDKSDSVNVIHHTHILTMCEYWYTYIHKYVYAHIHKRWTYVCTYIYKVYTHKGGLYIF